MTKLFLDDVRQAPDMTWDVVRHYAAFIKYIQKNGLPDMISFDHDLADEHYPWNDSSYPNLDYSSYQEKTGYSCIQWLKENGYPIKKHWKCHSFNPVGKANIEKFIERYGE